MKFLIVDDNPDDRILIVRELQRAFLNSEFVEAFERRTFEEAVDRGGMDVVLTDYRLRWSDGLWVLRTVRERFPNLPVVMVTGTGNEEVSVEGMKSGLSDYLLKDHLRRLPGVVRESLEKARLSAERREAAEALRRGHEALEIRVQERTAQLAKAIEILQAEITERRLADEARKAAEFELEAQATLLRVLETRTLRRVGGAREIQVRVRVIAATKEDTLMLGQEPWSLDAPFESDDDFRLSHVLPDLLQRSPDAGVIEESNRDHVERVLGTLKEREAQVLRLYLGLGDQEPLTLEEIGERFRLSRERVRQIKESALEKLRSPSHRVQIEALMESV